MRTRALLLSAPLSLVLLALGVGSAFAQDTSATPPRPFSYLDTSGFSYNILVNGNYTGTPGAGSPPQYATLQAAYAAAPAGTATSPTVIGIMPNVYNLNGGQFTPGLTISKNYITLLGLTNDHRNVVLAGNLGNEEGAGDATDTYNGYVIVVSATGFSAINLTILNYCNLNYEYPGDPSKNLTETSSVITQAVALQTSGDKHIFDHVALLSRLDTTFIGSTRAYFNDVYIEGTNDFIGGGTESVWENSTVYFPTGSGEGTVSGTVFINSTFAVPAGGSFEFYKGPTSGGAYPEGSTLPAAVINCVLPVNTAGNTDAWVLGYAPAHQNIYSLTYQNVDTNGNPVLIADASQGPITYTLGRELTAQQAEAFNPGNILSATPTGVQDNWDPAGFLATYTGQTVPGLAYYNSMGEGSLPFGMGMTNGSPSIISGQTTATINATVDPARAPNTITWSTSSNLVSLNNTTGASVIVTGTNNTGVSQYVPINATAENGFYITAWVFVQPPFISPPTIISGPTLSAPFNGTVTVNYTLSAVPNRTDESIITWYSCTDSSGDNPREVAISNGNVPLKVYTLQLGDVGLYLKATIQPKWDISNAGTAVSVIATTPITISNIVSTTVSPNFMNFPPAAEGTYVSGYWTVLGTWTSEAAPVGSTFVNGWGLRVGSQGASILYQQDSAYGDMQVNVVMSPEKTAGQGFGSPGAGADSTPPGCINTCTTYVQNADIYIKYDPRTQNGYSLRWWRTTASSTDVMFQLYQHVNGVSSPVSATQELTGVFLPNTYVTLSIVGSTFTASAYNTKNTDTLLLQGTVTPNSYGGAGTRWSGTVPSGNSNVYSMFQISYPGTVQLSTTATLTAAGSGYQANVTVTNSGTAIAQNVALDTATLGSASGASLPVSLGSIAPGGSATVTITYPSSAGAPGAGAVEKYAGIYTGGSFTASIRAVLP
jgi:hypothetical protein